VLPPFLIPSAFLAGTLFLLSADMLFLDVGGNKIKVGYLLLLCLWLFKPEQMFDTAKDAVLRLPKWVLLPLIPLAISVVASANLRHSIGWASWFGFDLLVVATVYSFLKVQQFSIDRIQTSIAFSLGLIALCGMVQFIAIYGFHHIIFNPQLHFNIYRINGISGWPHFLNIFSFLLLDRKILLHRYLAFLLPITVAALLLPTPSPDGNRQAGSGAEKAVSLAADLNIDDKTTSGADRMLINEMGLRVWMKHPWFGVGPRAYSTYVFERFDQELPGENKLDANRQINAKNENIWIEFLAESGTLFTLGFVLVLVRALWVGGWAFANPLHLGSWLALVLYFLVSGQFSQSGLLTMTYAVLGIFFYSRTLPSANARHIA
jgi:hypothetical protein